jgi:hypothetical protein
MLPLALSLLVAQEPPLELHAALPDPVVAALAAPVGNGVRWVRHAQRDLFELLRARRIDGVVVGLEGAWLAAIAADGGLRALPAVAPDLLAPCRDPQGRFFVPWLIPFTFAHRGEPFPKDHDELAFDRRFEDRIALCGPETTPAPWLGWMHRMLRQDASAEHGFAWWRTLDARIARYCSSETEALDRLQQGQATVAIVSLPAAQARAPELAVHAPAGGMLVHGCGVAVTIAAPPAAERLCAQLVDAPLALALARAGAALPAPRAGLDLAALSPALRDAYERLQPYDPDPRAAAWLARFDAGVRGEGRRTAWLEDALDLIFGLLFAAALVVLWRRTRSSP